MPLLEGLRHIGTATEALTATAGTVNVGTCWKTKVQAVLDTNSGYDVAVKPSMSAAATASKSSCAVVLTNNVIADLTRPGGGGANWYLAYQVYNNATASAGGTYDKLVVEKLG